MDPPEPDMLANLKYAAAMSRKRLQWLLIFVVTLAGVAGFAALMLTQSSLGRQPKPPTAPLVEVVEAQATAVPVTIRAMGGVRAAQLVRLTPQVTGQIVHVSPKLIPGGQVERDEVLIRIDPSDYDLAVRRAQAAVTAAQLSLQVELGHRAVAQQEIALFEDKSSSPPPSKLGLASREPYVKNAQAQLDAAQSELQQALLARQRTVLRAPFDARVSERSVDVGQVVSPQSVAAVLVASDEVWIEATLPVEHLRWIDIPGADGEAGAEVVVRHKLDGAVETVRHGHVLALLPELQGQGQLARLLVQVSDPFGAAAEPAEDDGKRATADLPLLVGSFVQLEIRGHKLDGLIPLPRGALREGKEVWVREPGGTLAIRPVKVIWSEGGTVYVRGELSSGEAVITSRLATPLPGLAVSLAKDQNPPAGADNAGKKQPPKPDRTSPR